MGVRRRLLEVSCAKRKQCLRHAAAGHVRLRLDDRPNAVSLRVSDDRRGFLDDLASPHTPEHCGSIPMTERVVRFGGRFEIRTRPGSGPAVAATVQLPGVE